MAAAGPWLEACWPACGSRVGGAGGTPPGGRRALAVEGSLACRGPALSPRGFAFRIRFGVQYSSAELALAAEPDRSCTTTAPPPAQEEGGAAATAIAGRAASAHALKRRDERP